MSLTVAEPGQTEVSGRLILLNRQGEELGAVEVTVRPEAQLIRTLADLFPAQSADFTEGSLVGHFDGDLLATAITFNKFLGALERVNLITQVLAP